MNSDSRLSMVSAAHQCVGSQLGESSERPVPRRVNCSSMKAEPAALGSLMAPLFESLSGVHGFCG